jgi:hypothetical protein
MNYNLSDNVPAERLLVTFATTPTNFASPLQPDCVRFVHPK